MTFEMLVALVIGGGMIAGYVWLGVWCSKATWRESASLSRRWVRVLMVSAIVTFFFAPGVMGAGHGAAVVPAWLMFTSGSFRVLTGDSKRNVLLFILTVWVVVFVIGLLVSRRKSPE
jgi:hypothetical protein